MKAGLTRRDLFSMFARPFQGQLAGRMNLPEATEAQPKVAIIQGRYCLALQSFCASCFERCPVPGAMERQRGMPMVVADVCTGCGICHQVCPAPVNAVLMMPRRKPLTVQRCA